MNLEEIRKKVEAGQELTREEEIFYMVEVLNFPREEALRIIAINDNKDPNMIVD